MRLERVNNIGRSTALVPILMYHQVSSRIVNGFNKYTVTPRAFAAQMAWLSLAGYTPIPLDLLVESYGAHDR